jgi:hypothetical protein
MWYVVTCHIYHNLRALISLYSNYIYSDTCVTVVTLHGIFNFEEVQALGDEMTRGRNV